MTNMRSEAWREARAAFDRAWYGQAKRSRFADHGGKEMAPHCLRFQAGLPRVCPGQMAATTAALLLILTPRNSRSLPMGACR